MRDRRHGVGSVAVRLRPFGTTGLAVSEIGFGCGSSAGLMIDGGRDQRIAAIGRALERGITLFDTAPVYGAGRSERNLGDALRALDARPVIATKVALELADLDDIAGAVVRSIEGSCERLGLDRIAIVHMHNRVGRARAERSSFGSGAVLTLDDVLGANGVADGFDRARRLGLVQCAGAQAFGGEIACIEALIDSGRFDALVVNYSILNASAFVAGPVVNPAFAYDRVGARAAARGLGVVALRVLEAGALATGFERHALAADPGAPDYAAYVSQALTLRFLADAADATLVAPAIRFALGTPGVSTVLVGVSDIAHVDAAADAAAQGPLGADQLAAVAALRCRGFRAESSPERGSDGT